MSCTLHEAIEYAREGNMQGCIERYKENNQLADWLEELEKLREVLGEDYTVIAELLCNTMKSRWRMQ